MDRFRVWFRGCVPDFQDSQTANREGDDPITRITFDLEVDGTAYPGMYVDVKPADAPGSSQGRLQVGPHLGGYQGPFPRARFNEAVERYYRSLGEEGHASETDGLGRSPSRPGHEPVPAGPFTFDFTVEAADRARPAGGDAARAEPAGGSRRLNRVENRVFHQEVVLLDGTEFVNCVFIFCRLAYRATAPFNLNSCDLREGTRVDFQGAAAETLRVLKIVYHYFGPSGAAFVEYLFNNIRQRPSSGTRAS
jgi:hypothetical protein